MFDLRSDSDLLIVVVVIEDSAIVVSIVGVYQNGFLVRAFIFLLSILLFIALFIIFVCGGIPLILFISLAIGGLADLQVLSMVHDIRHHEFLFSDSEEDLLVESVVEVVD